MGFKKFQEGRRNAGPSTHAILDTGGEDVPEPEWGTWSSETPRETLGVFDTVGYLRLYFTVAPVETLSSQVLVGPRIYDEVALMRQ